MWNTCSSTRRKALNPGISCVPSAPSQVGSALHPDGHAPARPVDVPILVGALGPKGHKVAHELGDALFATLQVPDFLHE